MEKIIWDDSFSVGVAELDKQHQELIRMLNKLMEAKDAAVNSEVISSLLSAMTKYVDYHLKTEEQYMMDYDYPGFSEHKKQHKAFMQQTHIFCMDTMNHKATVPTEMLSFLRVWLTDHILKEDMRYKSYFKEKGVK